MSGYFTVPGAGGVQLAWTTPVCRHNRTQEAISSWVRAVSKRWKDCDKSEISCNAARSTNARVRWRSSTINERRSADVATAAPESKEGKTVIVLGIILALIGFFAGISILTTIGIILVVVGAVLTILGATGRAVGGRKTFY